MMHRPSWAHLLLMFLVAGAAGGCKGPPSVSYEATIAEAKAVAREVMSETQASALALAFFDGEQVIWAETIGVVDVATNQPVTPTTKFAICSMSKIFATVSVMKLVEEGQVVLDTPVVTYLPEFSMISPEHRDITVRMLIDHSSGLPGGIGHGATTSEPVHDFAAKMLQEMKYQRLRHTPGYTRSYCNEGFTMVEPLIKARTGTDYPEFVRQKILAPLGMSDSRFADTLLPEGSYVKPCAGTQSLPYLSINPYATGGLWSTATDIGKFAQMLMNGGAFGAARILDAGSIERMAQDQTVGSFAPESSDAFRYGLGWDTVKEEGLSRVGIRAWQKSGAFNDSGARYFRTTMIVAPEERLGVVVLVASNKIDGETPAKIGERVLLRAFVERGTLAQMPATLSTTPLPIQAPTAEEKSSFPGYYASAGALYRLSFAADDSLTLESYPDWKPDSYQRRSDGWYASDNSSTMAFRLVETSGQRYLAVRTPAGAGHYATTSLFAQRLEAQGAFSESWKARQNVHWLPVNDDSFAKKLDADLGDPSVGLSALPDLEGYMLAGGGVLRQMVPPSDQRLDGMFLQIPPSRSTYLADLAIERRGDDDWARLGHTLMRPASSVPEATASTTVTIGDEGLAEWRKLPAGGSITIGKATAWRLYSTEFKQLAAGAANGSAVLPGVGDAYYLLLYGTPGVAIDLKIQP